MRFCTIGAGTRRGNRRCIAGNDPRLRIFTEVISVLVKQRAATERVNHHDGLKVPSEFRFATIGGLSNEMVERLERARPQNFGQVRNIAGLTPAALSAVLVHLTSHAAAPTA